MDHIHPETTDHMTTLRSVIEASVAAGFERYIGESLSARIEREVNAALNRRLARPVRHSNAHSHVTVPSVTGIEPIGEASSIYQPTISTAPSNVKSQHVPEALPADSVRSAAPVGKRRVTVTKPARWNIIDLTEMFDEQPEESLNVTSSIRHRVADVSNSLMSDEQGNDADNIAGVDAPDHEAAASTIRADWIQEARISTPKRSFEAMVQRAPTADMHANPHKKSRSFDPQKTASEEVDSYDSEEVDSYDSEEVDSSDSEELDSHDSDEVSSYDSEEFDSYDSEEIDSHDSDEVDSYDSRKPALVTPPTIEVRKKATLPGYTTGPPVRFLKLCSQLTADPKRRGWPRIVDLKDFMDESNKQNLTMADIVATILWKHGPRTLRKFLDFEGRPEFQFNRWELHLKSKECWIRRYLDEEGVVTVAVCNSECLSRQLY